MSIRGDTVTFLGHHHSVVIGHGGLAAVGESLGQVPGITALSEPPTEPRDRSAITVFATDFGNGTVPPAEWLDRLATREGLTIAVVGAPATAADLDPTTAREIARLRSAVDATVVIPPEHHRQGVRSVVTTLHEIVARPGVINLDPADIRTVLDHGEAAAITTGKATSTGDVAADTLHAVEDALDSAYADIDGLSAVLVNVVGDDDLTLESAVDAVDGIQATLPDDAVLIWGVAVEDSVSAVHAQVVAGSTRTPVFDRVVRDARQPSAGDNCPRCGGHVAVYTLGERETAACDDCGYAGTSTTL
ncbi:hypothetical protein NDI56_06940 [Haloarcula sp. S1CR25-12]|uniref:Tubulin/FtsZ 2-layer sandwich domain-containing protein n=1 Tax=Haloarcula saliterrae TaxID=2950534 RepID=A0ABU2FBC4_9EURY|nr:hypothetical protein [Haloarcula sp. S1CR25-12]MDS0259126.1 hypothetical protein [Haloarcula sp. S1CR25-12]